MDDFKLSNFPTMNNKIKYIYTGEMEREEEKK